ncbi:hypothetical protein AYI69_g10154 [Smittium culicis]|uniref:Uncharacterized protein n=1 Tax=Smittium culicis TaxID=133412 RepID=A0A1R1X7P4_9FUNG|nr:hypothetical protein AYI69_g10154 [Smittium culicis]
MLITVARTAIAAAPTASAAAPTASAAAPTASAAAPTANSYCQPLQISAAPHCKHLLPSIADTCCPQYILLLPSLHPIAAPTVPNYCPQLQIPAAHLCKHLQTLADTNIKHLLPHISNTCCPIYQTPAALYIKHLLPPISNICCPYCTDLLPLTELFCRSQPITDACHFSNQLLSSIATTIWS